MTHRNRPTATRPRTNIEFNDTRRGLIALDGDRLVKQALDQAGAEGEGPAETETLAGFRLIHALAGLIAGSIDAADEVETCLAKASNTMAAIIYTDLGETPGRAGDRGQTVGHGLALQAIGRLDRILLDERAIFMTVAAATMLHSIAREAFADKDDARDWLDRVNDLARGCLDALAETRAASAAEPATPETHD